METMAVRQSWNDDRIDGLELKVDEGFRHVDKRFEQVDRRLDRIEGELHELGREMNARFDSLQRTLLVFGGGMFAAFSTQLILILTQG
jgi:hypothetical protein